MDMSLFIWTACLLLAYADARKPNLLFANNSGVYIQNLTSGVTKTVIPYSWGAVDVDYTGDGDIYAILGSNNPLNKRLVRARSTTASGNEACQIDDWCKYDDLCNSTCISTEYKELKGVRPPYGCKHTSNLVVDWTDNRMYWSCKDAWINSAVVVGGVGVKNVSYIGSDKILDMKIDPYERKLFWLKYVEKDQVVKLVCLSLDNSNITEIHELQDNSHMNSMKIILDVPNKWLYLQWGVQGDSKRMNYNGTDVSDVTLMQLPYPILDKNISKWMLYDPMMQSDHLDCNQHGCKDGCQLLTWKGVECIKSSRQTSSQKTSTTNVGQTTISVAADIEPGSVDIMTTPSTEMHNTTVSRSVEGANVTSKEAEAVSASTGSGPGRILTIFLVILVLWASVFVVIIIIKRRITHGNYRPASPDECLQMNP